jgi:hypothetical protein
LGLASLHDMTPKIGAGATSFQPPYVIAHRGASGQLPEHTIPAYKRAIEQGTSLHAPSVQDHSHCQHLPGLRHITARHLQPACAAPVGAAW